MVARGGSYNCVSDYDLYDRFKRNIAYGNPYEPPVKNTGPITGFKVQEIETQSINYSLYLECAAMGEKMMLDLEAGIDAITPKLLNDVDIHSNEQYKKKYRALLNSTYERYFKDYEKEINKIQHKYQFFASDDGRVSDQTLETRTMYCFQQAWVYIVQTVRLNKNAQDSARHLPQDLGNIKVMTDENGRLVINAPSGQALFFKISLVAAKTFKDQQLDLFYDTYHCFNKCGFSLDNQDVAVRVGIGGINVLTGEKDGNPPVLQNLGKQNYLSAKSQEYLDGYLHENTVRQFVVVRKDSKESVSDQLNYELTDNEQLEITFHHPRKEHLERSSKKPSMEDFKKTIIQNFERKFSEYDYNSSYRLNSFWKSYERKHVTRLSQEKQRGDLSNDEENERNAILCDEIIERNKMRKEWRPGENCESVGSACRRASLRENIGDRPLMGPTQEPKGAMAAGVKIDQQIIRDRVSDPNAAYSTNDSSNTASFTISIKIDIAKEAAAETVVDEAITYQYVEKNPLDYAGNPGDSLTRVRMPTGIGILNQGAPTHTQVVVDGSHVPSGGKPLETGKPLSETLTVPGEVATVTEEVAIVRPFEPPHHNYPQS